MFIHIDSKYFNCPSFGSNMYGVMLAMPERSPEGVAGEVVFGIFDKESEPSFSVRMKDNKDVVTITAEDNGSFRVAVITKTRGTRWSNVDVLGVIAVKDYWGKSSYHTTLRSNGKFHDFEDVISLIVS